MGGQGFRRSRSKTLLAFRCCRDLGGRRRRKVFQGQRKGRGQAEREGTAKLRSFRLRGGKGRGMEISLKGKSVGPTGGGRRKSCMPKRTSLGVIRRHNRRTGKNRWRMSRGWDLS